MKYKEVYYVYVSSRGKLGRVAKRTEGKKYYGWDNGKWILMPQLRSMEYDITNFEEITKEEAYRIIKEEIKNVRSS